MSVKKRDNLSISPWIRRFLHLVPPSGKVLDLAAGAGRHCVWFLETGHDVTALDRRTDDLEALRRERDAAGHSRLEVIEADLEDGSPWPLAGRHFDAVVVVNYLHRPLFPRLLNSLAPGGLFLYDTFAVGNESFGRPSHPDFLLRPGELLDAVRGRLQVVAYDHGLIDAGKRPAVKQRIAAIAGDEPVALEAS